LVVVDDYRRGREKVEIAEERLEIRKWKLD
jgi:hypothetical protein